MGSAAFNLTSVDGAPVESGTVTLQAGERVLVRFTARSNAVPGSTVMLKIVSNAVTSYVEVSGFEAWVTDAPLAGSVISVVVRTIGKGSVTVAGVVECGQ